MNLLKKHWLWLLLIFIPLWLIAAVGELMDARLLQNEGVTVEGKSLPLNGSPAAAVAGI